MVGIVDWRLAELERRGVIIHYDTYASAEEVVPFAPDLVVVATGGIAQSPELEAIVRSRHIVTDVTTLVPIEVNVRSLVVITAAGIIAW
jgi:hypothetical protein